MRLGVLDVGSNTVHLLVVDAQHGGPPDPQASHKSVLRLMRYLEDDGSISPKGVRAVVEAVEQAAAQASDAGVDDVLPFATSALREATNGPDLLATVEAETGLRLQVLTGEDEARITFLAVRRWYGWSAGELLVIDIGGGSLELAAGANEDPNVAVSLPLGAGRTTVGFLRSDPPKQREVEELRAHAADQLQASLSLFTERPPPTRVVGSSKTIRSLSKLAGSTDEGVGAQRRRTLTLDELQNWVPRLAKLPAEARPALPGVSTNRAFQIVAGGIVLAETMRAFQVETLEVSPWALREGLILLYLDHLD